MNFSPVVSTEQRQVFELHWDDGELCVGRESIFQLIRNIKDPEHDYTLEQLNVVCLEDICIYSHVEDPSASQAAGVSGLGGKQWAREHHQTEEEVKRAGQEVPVFVEIKVVPTIPHCSMVGLIGLSILYKVTKIISSRYVVRVIVKKGTHTLDEEMTKQLEDIERTSSAFINPAIVATITELI
ncbi:hypothetical protein NEDG_00643 [Nematocida displodere]|uniref:MIP18 family-like domain-containing protein n=1 Tax=Nematocida displodere TaxID=1805483 RepID=A0A177EDP0_9MICR|nr:hypothetical protein NEDG_00643 [Nematocida displodere]